MSGAKRQDTSTEEYSFFGRGERLRPVENTRERIEANFENRE